jgi:hypothetical protein
MKKRSKAGGRPIKGPRRKTQDPKPRSAPKAASRSTSSSAVETEVARIARELNETSQQQAATSEVLQLISSSPNDLQAIFSTILKKAVSICDAKFGNIYRWANNALSLVATHDTDRVVPRLSKFCPHRLRTRH